MVSTVAREITGPTPGCVANRRAASHASASLPTSPASPAMYPVAAASTAPASGCATTPAQPRSTACASSASPGSRLCAAAGSSPASASAPDADDGSATVAGLARPPSEPRSWESDFPPSASESAPPLVDHAFASAHPAARSHPHPRSTARADNVPTDSQTNACSRWLRSLPAPAPAVPRRKPELPRYAVAGVRPTRPFPGPTLQSVGSSDESHTLYTSYTASFVSSASVLSTSSLTRDSLEAVAVIQSKSPLSERASRAEGSAPLPFLRP